VTRDGLAERLRERALLHGDFVLRSGRRSPVYLDKYRFETDPEILGPLAEALAETARDALGRVDRLAGPELGAVPLVTALGLHTGLPFLLVRSAVKEYGTSRRLEGVCAPGERVLLVEDVITTGGAALNAVEALRAEELEVEDAVCVLDREEGGAEALHTQGVRLAALFGRADLGLDAA
jgi:orotate phosphoribosyltransferase